MTPKFRAWIKDEEHSRMVRSDQAVMTAIKHCYGGTGVPEGTTGYHYVDTARRPGKYILMQSTGLKDKHGVEIFEGDCFKEGFGRYVVFWDRENACFALKAIGDGITLPISQIKYMDLSGNIHENPELLSEVE